MLRFPEVIRISLRQNRLNVFAGGFIAVALLCATHASAQTVATYDFENGNTQGWGSFNGASTPVSTNAATYTNSYSLLTTTNSSGNSSGPSIALGSVLQAGATYSITGWVRLTSGESPQNANFTIARTDPSCSGGTCYDTIGPFTTQVTASGWVQIGGSYTPATTETALLLYAQLVGASSTQSFYLDDVVLTQTAPAPGGSTVKEYTFSDGGTDGWFAFGPASVNNAVLPTPDPNAHTNGLLTTNRSASYMGPAVNLVGVNGIVAGATYQVSAYVLLATSDTSGPTVTMSTKLTNCANSDGAYSNLGTTAALSNGVWTKVQGTFTFSNQPGPPSELDLYFQSSSANDSFYISDVRIGELAPPPPDPSQQDNSGISSNFEDGGLDGWSGRGAATVANASGVGHNSNNSLLVSGRAANWQGPQISVSNKMYVGSVYNVSGWVMLPTDGLNHVINISLQTTIGGNTSFPSVTGYPGVTVPGDGQWHQISVMGYNMSSAYDQGQASLYFQTVPPSTFDNGNGPGNDYVSFYLDDFQLTYVQPPSIQSGIPSIFETMSPYFPIGAAVDSTDLSGAHEQLLTKHFDSITPGNEMKWSSVENTKGSFTYGPADAEVGVAVCNNMQVRGHNLVWATGAQTPSYAAGDGTSSTSNQAAVTANIQEHIQSEVTHFGNKVSVWDVVNEPLDPGQPDCLVHGPFYKVLGESYLDIAFNAAHAAAPNAKLFLNDYSTADPNRLSCLVQVVGRLLNRGVPISGVGHEFHNAINYPTVNGMVNAVNTIAENFPGLDQQVTEYDESVYNAGDSKSNYGNNIPASVLAEQGWLYADTFDSFKELKGKISRVTIWGMADDDTWLDSFPVNRTDYPLPFDMGLQAKPAYWGIVDETKLPGYGLAFSSAITAGIQDTRTVTLTAKNGNVGPAYGTQINGFTLKQVSGPPCTVGVKAPGPFPITLGDLPANGTANAKFTLSLTANCNPNAKWTIAAPWTANTYENGTFTLTTDFNRGK